MKIGIAKNIEIVGAWLRRGALGWVKLSRGEAELSKLKRGGLGSVGLGRGRQGLVGLGIVGLVWAGLGLSGCRSYTPTQKQKLDSVYCVGYLEQYGKAYTGLERNVYALDLYTEGMALDSTRHIVGSGLNLYLSDIFLNDTAFQIGTYRSDTTAEAFTFLPGQDFEGMPTGMYLLSISDGKSTGIQVLDSGRMEVSRTTDSLYHIELDLYYNKGTQYKARFEGALENVDRR